MTTYVLVHPRLECDVAKFKDLPSTETFLKELSPAFRDELLLQNWVDFKVTRTRPIASVFTFD